MEFGVYTGFSVNLIASHTKNTVYGFDSFEGLPEDWGINDTLSQKKEVRYEQGKFSLQGKLPEVRENVVLVKGWFNESLKHFMYSNSDPVHLLHVDCDLYSSTKTIFQYTSHRLVPGSIIVFDEITMGEDLEHELLAFFELVREEKIEFEWIARSNSNFNNVAVRVLKVPNSIYV